MFKRCYDCGDAKITEEIEEGIQHLDEQKIKQKRFMVEWLAQAMQVMDDSNVPILQQPYLGFVQQRMKQIYNRQPIK